MTLDIDDNIGDKLGCDVGDGLKDKSVDNVGNIGCNVGDILGYNVYVFGSFNNCGGSSDDCDFDDGEIKNELINFDSFPSKS